MENAEWYNNFEEEAKALAEKIDEENEVAREEARCLLQNAERNKRAVMVKKLMEDSRFLSGRPSVQKRILLAQTLFPDLDHGTVRVIVSEADSELWLAKTGQKEP
jgi:hypothetical protein